MKKQRIRTLAAGFSIILLAAIVAISMAAGCKKKSDAKWKIGFSQCTTTEPWRVLFNERMKAEAKKHPEIELVMQDAEDKLDKQVEQVDGFITKGYDLIIISPKEQSGFGKVLARAKSKGIPVIILDRAVDTDDYTTFIGADNMEIGRAAGRYVEKLAEDAGGALNVYEIWGGKNSTPAQERHKGFHEIVDKVSDVNVEGNQDCDWKLDMAKDVMATVLQTRNDIDVVYAHNDPMAYGAYVAAKDAGVQDKIKFIGIDGNPKEGVEYVSKGMLNATFLYPTPGEKGIQVALDILNVKKVPKTVTLETATVTKANAADFAK